MKTSVIPRVVVAIVNYRSAELVIECLRTLAFERVPSLAKCDARPPAESPVPSPATQAGILSVVVVDNASGDGSSERIARAIADNHWGAWVDLEVAEHNGGFAAGNNAAVRKALDAHGGAWPEFVWFLNPDTYVRTGACAALLEFLDSHPDVGIVGSRLEDPDGTGQASRYRFPSIASEFESGLRLGLVSRLLSKKVVATPLVDEAHETGWVAGASMMVRRAVFADIGLMDERYFLYFEETDFCLAARRAGWRCWYVPKSRVVHFVGQSTGVTVRNAAPRKLPRYWFESRRRYFVKNHGRFYTLCADVAWTIGYSLWRLRRPLQGKPDLDPPHLLADFVRFNFVPERS